MRGRKSERERARERMRATECMKSVVKEVCNNRERERDHHVSRKYNAQIEKREGYIHTERQVVKETYIIVYLLLLHCIFDHFIYCLCIYFCHFLITFFVLLFYPIAFERQTDREQKTLGGG